MKTPRSVFVFSVAGCLSSALCATAVVSTAAAADTSASLSLLQQPSLDAAITKALSSGTAPILPSPAALVLTAPKGKTAVGTLTLKKSSTDQHTYYLSTNQSWIWMNPPYGSTQSISTETDQLVITAQTANLAVGTYSAVVYVVDSGPNNFTNMLRIPVSFTVTAETVAPPPAPAAVTPAPKPVVLTPPPPPTPLVVPPPPAPAPPAPTVTPTSGIVTAPLALTLSAVKGQTAVGTLALRKGGTDQHTYYLSTNQSWVWMNPPYGSTQTITTETDQLVITAQTSGLAAGTYSAIVYVVESGPNNFSNMLRIPVTLTVTATPVATPPPAPPSPPAAVTPTPKPVVLTPPPPPTPVVVPPPPAPVAVPPPPAPAPPAPAPTPVATGPIQVTPAALSLSSSNAVGTLTLRKTGTDQHAYYISASQSWVWMNPPYGSTQTITTEADQIVVTAQSTGLAAGTYSAVVYIVESGPNNFSNTLRIPVSFTVTGGQTASAAPTTPTQPTVAAPPPPPPTPVPTPVPSTPSASAATTTPTVASATVSWNANTETDLAGYRIYVGTRSGSYGFVGPFEVTNRTSFTIPNLPTGTTYYFAVSAFDKSGNESAKSAEVSKSLF